MVKKSLENVGIITAAPIQPAPKLTKNSEKILLQAFVAGMELSITQILALGSGGGGKLP